MTTWTPQSHFLQIGQMVDRVNMYQANPPFSTEYNLRLGWAPNYNWTDCDVLRRLACLIAYSQNARANLIWNLINDGVLDRAFANFDVSTVARLNPDTVLSRHWPEPGQTPPTDNLGAFRFRRKVAAIIKCAQILQRLASAHNAASFMDYLKIRGIPAAIGGNADFQRFWSEFDRVRIDLAAFAMPFFSNFTSLCHLFMDMGYPCAKPDLAVMRTAALLGVVPPQTQGGVYPEAQRRYVVYTMQFFGVHRKLPTSVVDLYFLIHGRQTGISDLVQPGYYI